MPKVSHEVLTIIQQALNRYIEEVEATHLSPLSKTTYIGHSREFVRWLDDDFEPGANVR